MKGRNPTHYGARKARNSLHFLQILPALGAEHTQKLTHTYSYNSIKIRKHKYRSKTYALRVVLDNEKSVMDGSDGKESPRRYGAMVILNVRIAYHSQN